VDQGLAQPRPAETRGFLGVTYRESKKMNTYQTALENATNEWGQIVLSPETYCGPTFRLESDVIMMGLNPLGNEAIAVRIPVCDGFAALAAVELESLVGAKDQSAFARLYEIAAKFAGLR